MILTSYVPTLKFLAEGMGAIERLSFFILHPPLVAQRATLSAT